jgi:hypothetical protein
MKKLPLQLLLVSASLFLGISSSYAETIKIPKVETGDVRVRDIEVPNVDSDDIDDVNVDDVVVPDVRNREVRDLDLDDGDLEIKTRDSSSSEVKVEDGEIKIKN